MAPHVFSANAAAQFRLRTHEFRSGFADERPGHATFVGVALVVYAWHQKRPLALLARPFFQVRDRLRPAARRGKLSLRQPYWPIGFLPAPGVWHGKASLVTAAG